LDRYPYQQPKPAGVGFAKELDLHKRAGFVFGPGRKLFGCNSREVSV